MELKADVDMNARTKKKLNKQTYVRLQLKIKLIYFNYYFYFNKFEFINIYKIITLK